MITIDKDLLQPSGEPSSGLLKVLLDKHSRQRTRLDELKDIYERKHAITTRSRLKGLPNNKLVHDLPNYIVTMSAGYLVGEPVKYTAPVGQETAFKAVADALKAASVDSVDAELAVDAAVYGKGIEICYADKNAAPQVAQLDARSAFVVYDDTVEHNPLCGIVIRDLLDKMLTKRGERVTLYTANEIISYERISNEMPHETAREPHYFGAVPIVEYWNNARQSGDFEPVMSLIDAYDVLQSDRLNDKQQFTDAILVLKGVGALGADDTEETYLDESGEEQVADVDRKEQTDPSARLRQTRTMFLPSDGADAGFITKPDAEGGSEVLRMSLKSDIHKLSMIPDLSDEDFAGNASGVAMRFKLLGLEQLTKIKERWFREGLRSRLRLFANFLSIKGAAAINADNVQIGFTRSLPVNELEIAQTVAVYDDIVPKELLYSQIPFIDDPQAAMEMHAAEQAENAKYQRDMFSRESFDHDEDGRYNKKNRP